MLFVTFTFFHVTYSLFTLLELTVKLTIGDCFFFIESCGRLRQPSEAANDGAGAEQGLVGGEHGGLGSNEEASYQSGTGARGAEEQS